MVMHTLPIIILQLNKSLFDKNFIILFIFGIIAYKDYLSLIINVINNKD
jgi:hypothetical protein